MTCIESFGDHERTGFSHILENLDIQKIPIGASDSTRFGLYLAHGKLVAGKLGNKQVPELLSTQSSPC